MTTTSKKKAKKKDIHQDLMDSSYAVWQAHKEWSKEDFWRSMNYQCKVAVSLGNLNYQVCNGGFEQWKFNGYAETHLGFLMNLLCNLDSKKYPLLTRIGEMLEKSDPIFDEIDELESHRRDGFDNDEEEDDFNDDIEYQYNKLDKFDSEYYKMEEKDILKEMKDLIIHSGEPLSETNIGQ